MTYEIRYGKRKTIQLTITQAKKLVVHAPKGYPKAKIEAFVHSKEAWVKRKLEEMPALEPQKQFKTGESFWVLGEAKRLCLAYGSVESVMLSGGDLIVTCVDMQAERIRGLLIAWYYQLTSDKVMNYLKRHQGSFSVKPTKITVKDQQKRWGSCTSKGHIMFNWRLSMAPPEVIEYLVVHELSHLIHMDHSPAFWQEVNLRTPHKALSRKWLKDHYQAMYF